MHIAVINLLAVAVILWWDYFPLSVSSPLPEGASCHLESVSQLCQVPFIREGPLRAEGGPY